MVNRFSTLSVILGVVVGYALAGPSTKAQGFAGLPFAVSQDDRITLHFERGSLADTVISFDCTVDEVQSMWIRCRAGDSFQRQQRWYSLTRVVQITKQK